MRTIQIQFRITNLSNMHVVGLWEEARVAKENPHKENMQTPHEEFQLRNLML